MGPIAGSQGRLRSARQAANRLDLPRPAQQLSWDALSAKEVTRIVTLLEADLGADRARNRNLRLWVQAIRRSDNPPSIDSVIEKVAYWKNSAADSLDAVYYLYVFHTLRALEGSQINRDRR